MGFNSGFKGLIFTMRSESNDLESVTLLGAAKIAVFPAFYGNRMFITLF